MTELERFKDYMALCGIATNAELKDLGGYPCSKAQMNNVLNGKYNFNDVEKKRLYSACNRARAVKQGYYNSPLEKKEDKDNGND